MNNNKILPVVLCGGTGTRLWPLSRESFPKQYLAIREEESLTFLQRTINRINKYENVEDPIVICNEEHRFIVAEQLRSNKIKAKSILLEPLGRNTAPAITAACLKAIEKKQDPLILVLPADHIISDEKTFIQVIEKAVNYAQCGKLVTFGITPNKPETGFGYIESENELDLNKLEGERILRFIEKPNITRAEKLISDKRFTWNSGIFFFKASSFLNEIIKFCPDIYKYCKKALLKNSLDLEFQRLDKELFSLCKKISIDNAIMEKTDLGIVLPLKAGWSDIGNWESMWEVSDKDTNNNVILGRVVSKNVKNSYLRSEDRLIVGLGIENLIVVECNDAILISRKDQVQDIKGIVEDLAKRGDSEATIHKTIFRPWGNYTSVAEGKNWQVKKITVKPGESLSLQLHKYRTEHWIVVSGKACVEINGEETILNQNESTYIPLGSKHRLSNPETYPLTIIEIQSGNYLGEDDIVRFDDKYGRNLN